MGYLWKTQHTLAKRKVLLYYFKVAELHKSHPQIFLPNNIRLRGSEVFCVGQTDYSNF